MCNSNNGKQIFLSPYGQSATAYSYFSCYNQHSKNERSIRGENKREILSYYSGKLSIIDFPLTLSREGGPELTIQKRLCYIFGPYFLNGSSDLDEI